MSVAAYTVTVVPAGEQFRCPDDRSVLVGMEYLGARGIQVGCRNGGCGVCRVQVLTGTYTAKKMSKAHVSADDIVSDVVLSCRILPTSDLTVRVCPKDGHVAAPFERLPDHQH